MCTETLSIHAKELIEETLDGVVVDRWVWVEKVEIYIDERRSLLRAGHYRISFRTSNEIIHLPNHCQDLLGRPDFCVLT